MNASYIGMGWYDIPSSGAIYRNIENPVWYILYALSGRDFSRKTGGIDQFSDHGERAAALPLSNSSLLDEATAAAEAATMMYGLRDRAQVKENVETLFVDEALFPQTLSVLTGRMERVGIKVIVGDYTSFAFDQPVFGAILQYPNNNGSVEDYAGFVEKAKSVGCKVAVATDLLALVLPHRESGRGYRVW